MKKFILAALAALALAAMLPMVAMADTACTVTVTKFNQSYPYSGRATVEYTVGGTLPATAFAEITLRADGASARTGRCARAASNVGRRRADLRE